MLLNYQRRGSPWSSDWPRLVNISTPDMSSNSKKRKLLQINGNKLIAWPFVVVQLKPFVVPYVKDKIVYRERSTGKIVHRGSLWCM